MQLDREDFWEAADTLETIAAVEHERWAHWQNYLHNQCNVRDDGSLVIPPDLAARWAHQMATPYSKLSEHEKESDREQAREYLQALKRAANNILRRS